MSAFVDWPLRRDDITRSLEIMGEVYAREQVNPRVVDLKSPYGSSSDLYETTVRLLKDANFPSAKRFAEQAVLAFLDRCDELDLSHPSNSTLLRMLITTAEIYALEGVAPETVNSTTLPDPSPYGHGVAAGQLRDHLLRQQLKAARPAATLDTLRSAIIECFVTFTRRLPDLAFDDQEDESVPTIPLIDVLPDVGKLIEEVIDPLCESNDIGLFRLLREQFAARLDRVKERLGSRHLVSPPDYEGTPEEIVQAYIDTTPFRHLFHMRVPFGVSLEDRGEHTAIIAGSGWGKTQLLQSIIAADLETHDPPALVIIDSTGAMPQRIQRLAIFNERLKDRLIIIDPESDPVPALNMFDVSNPRRAAYSPTAREAIESEIIGLFNYVFSSTQNPLTTRMQTAFAFMVRLLLSIPGANMQTLLALLDDDPFKGDYNKAVFKPHIDKLDETTQHFFKVQYYTGKESGLREQIRARVFDIIKVPAFERMFAGANRVDFFAEMNRGAIIVINTSENLLKEGSPTFGRYMIARVMAAAFERATIPPDKRRQAFLIVDEAAPYFDETFEKLLTRVRQFKLGVCIAFQRLEQTSEKLRAAIASSTAVKYGGGTGYSDARWLAREMRVDPEFIMDQKRDARPPKWTQFACYVRNYTDRAISLTVPFLTLENMPQMSDAEHAALLERNRERVSAPPAPPMQEPIAEAPKPSKSAPEVVPPESRSTEPPACPSPKAPKITPKPPPLSPPVAPDEGSDDWR